MAVKDEDQMEIEFDISEEDSGTDTLERKRNLAKKIKVENEESDDDSEEESDGDSDEDEDTKADSSNDSETVDIDEEDLREEIRARRREERKQKRLRIKEREENYKRELDSRDSVISQLSGRLNSIERRNSGFDLAQIDSQMNQLNNAYVFERSRVAQGASESQGNVVADATEKMIQIQDKFKELTAIKRAFISSQNKAPALDPRLVNYAKDWQDKNPWYNSNGSDPDSEIVRFLDNSLANEGFDPTTERYWDELTKRVNKHVSHRTKKEYNDSNEENNSQRNKFSKSKSVVGSSGSASSANTGKTTITLSKERIVAIKDAGLWEDPIKRRAAIRQFQKYDKDHGE